MKLRKIWSRRCGDTEGVDFCEREVFLRACPNCTIEPGYFLTIDELEKLWQLARETGGKTTQYWRWDTFSEWAEGQNK